MQNTFSKVYLAMCIDNVTELAFDDVTPEDPDFPFIQGLAEAGLISSKLSRSDMNIPEDVHDNHILFSPERVIAKALLLKVGLSKCSGVTDGGISSLVARCSDLRTIDLTCCNLVTNNALDSIADNCKILECLRLESCSLINEKGLKRIATCCPNLKEIDLTDCGLDDAALQHLAKCSELRILKLGLCSSISDRGIVFISSNCGKLVELDLYRCNSITDDELAALANGCKRIKLLNLCYCNKIIDTGLGHLGSLEELTNLELRCLVRVIGIGISSVAIGCKNLIELDLKRCYSVDDAGLWALARYALNLRQLTISYCQVTGLGLCHLLSSLRCLQDIKMVHHGSASSLREAEEVEDALRAEDRALP
ncbi:F-box/LRR-repeat protein 3 [Zea mays]|uniref:F-box/LRR-repeat protein 3 n=1 Tax=Zea mays TaxID=4577 RepID=A0A3L6GEQ7_MAIZE|nr:F-box/LRR-repeat protein 3 [Zea mays]